MGAKKDKVNETSQDEGGVAGVQKIHIHNFITEQISTTEWQKLSSQYQTDILFQRQVDAEYNKSTLKQKLEKNGCEAYDFLTNTFANQNNEKLSEDKKNDIWKKIKLRIQ